MQAARPALSHLFIYYKVNAGLDASGVKARVRSMQASLAHRTGIQGRLFVREDAGTTWMEVYPPAPDPAAFMQALNEEVERAGLPLLLADGNQRHIETFIECA